MSAAPTAVAGDPLCTLGAHTVHHYELAKLPEGQARQTYPPDGSPRDISITGILFDGGSNGPQTDVFPRLPMTADSIRGNTLWYCNLHNLGVRVMRTFWWGYGTGVSLTGSFHAQAMYDTPLYLGGSENTIFGTGSQSFMDNSSQ